MNSRTRDNIRITVTEAKLFTTPEIITIIASYYLYLYVYVYKITSNNK